MKLIFYICSVLNEYKNMNLQIKVFANQSAYDNRKVLFERILNIPFGVSVPYQQLYDDMKFLFGDTSIIEFRCI